MRLFCSSTHVIATHRIDCRMPSPDSFALVRGDAPREMRVILAVQPIVEQALGQMALDAFLYAPHWIFTYANFS